MFKPEIIAAVVQALREDSHATSVIVSALRTAGEVYTNDARTMGMGRIGNHFSKQAREAITLADALEEAL